MILAVAALATLPPQKAASILTKLRNKGGNVRNLKSARRQRRSRTRMALPRRRAAAGGPSRRRELWLCAVLQLRPAATSRPEPAGVRDDAPPPLCAGSRPRDELSLGRGARRPRPERTSPTPRTTASRRTRRSDALDPKASAALACSAAKEADRIFDNLGGKGDAVRNLSAYVIKGSILNSDTEVAGAYSIRSEELPDIEEVPQAALHDAAACGRVWACNEAAIWRHPARGRRRSTPKRRGRRVGRAHPKFAVAASPSRPAARRRSRRRALRARGGARGGRQRPLAAPRPVEPPAASGCGEF